MLLRSVSRGDIPRAKELLRATETPDGFGEDAAQGPPTRSPLTVAEACPGAEHIVNTPAGEAKCWLIRRPLRDVAPDSLSTARRYAAVLRGARQNFDELAASAALCQVGDLSPGDLLFMDTETCGLSGAMVFLVGLMSYQGRQLVFEQYLARNYAEEAGMLQAFADRLAASGALVTFNGKAFDMTMIRERCAFHAVELADLRAPHLDLLHESRRRWRGQLPNCRLQTLERYLCSRHRVGDIPGHAIPQAYHDFVRTGDARRLKDILHHNMLDLLTMADLLSAILTGCDPVIE